MSDKELKEAGNTDGPNGKPSLMSYPAQRKAKSDYGLSERTDACCIKDLRNIKEEEQEGHQYIRSINETQTYKKADGHFTTEFGVTLMYEPVLDIVNTLKPIIGYLDATGTLIKVKCCPNKKFHHESRILNHILVFRDEELGLTIPLLEFISSMSNTDSLCLALNEMILLLESKNVKWPFKFIVIDWSKVYMHSLSETMNKVPFVTYLNLIYSKEKIPSRTPTFILSCVSHFVHTISRNCKRLLRPEQVHLKSTIIDIFCVLINCTSLPEVDDLVYKAIILLHSKYQTTDLINTQNEITDLIAVQNIKKEVEEENEKELDLDDDAVTGRKRISKTDIIFYQQFERTRDKALKAIVTPKGKKIMNPFYDEDAVFLKILDSYIAFVIVWSRILYHSSNISHVSNSVIENHNKTVKIMWFKKEFNNRPSKYVLTTKEKLRSLVGATKTPVTFAAFKTGKKHKKPAPLPQIENDILDRNQEETYGKKISGTKVTSSYHFSGQELKAKLKTTPSVIEIDDMDYFIVEIEKPLTAYQVEKVKPFIRQLKTYPCGIVQEKDYYDLSTLAYVKHENRWLHYDDFITLYDNHQLEVNVIEFYLTMKMDKR